jgi:hypothetical protein
MPTADLFTVRKAAPPAVLSLRASLHKLPQGDQDFARSLLSRADAGAMSAKVEHWIGVLSERASAPPAAKTDGLGKIVDILAGAARTLKFPVIRFEADGVQYRLGRSGPTSREPGSVNVTSEGNFADRSYFGRIGLDGIFQPSHKFGETATAIGAALRAFAADPVELLLLRPRADRWRIGPRWLRANLRRQILASLGGSRVKRTGMGPVRTGGLSMRAMILASVAVIGLAGVARAAEPCLDENELRAIQPSLAKAVGVVDAGKGCVTPSGIAAYKALLKADRQAQAQRVREAFSHTTTN